ncbi:MAG: PD40 domain-containing protein [Bacteroidales bacterium]|nr:PD40 domain-containing protein [Bacteroidales bacterium]
MKKILLILGCCVMATAAMAQSDLLDSLSDYQGRFSKLNKAYSKSPDNVEALYNLALFYFDNSHPMRNLPMAMKYIQRAEACHINLIENDHTGELSRLVRLGITLTSIRQTKQAIIDAAYNTLEVRTDLSAVELDTYLDAFGIDMDLVRLLRQRRISQVYDECLRKGTIDAYHHFIDIYPGTSEAEQMEQRIARLAPGLFEGVTNEEQADAVASRYPLSPSVQRAAEKQKSRMAFAVASKRNDVQAYMDFLDRYPSSDESQQARDRLDKLLEVTYAKCKTPMDFALFAKNYPDISLADKALAEVRALLSTQQDLAAARFYLKNFSFDPAYNDVYNIYYSWHAAEGNGDPIRRFDRENPDYPLRRAIENDLESAKIIDRINLMEDFLEVEYNRYAGYVRQLTGKRISIVPLQRMIQVMVATRNYSAALDRVRRFDICFDNVCKNEYAELQRVLAAPATGRHTTKELSATYHVMNPCVNAADGRLYFTRAAGASRRICFAVKEGGQWRPAGEVTFSSVVNTDAITLFGFFGDGNHMLFGTDGNILIAERDGENWRITDNLPYPVNTDYIETDAYMLPDGSGLLLASDRPNGFNLQGSGAYFHGDTAMATDLYFIPYNNNTWGTPVNLGPTINTPYCERSPILSRNLKTLYFISDGRGGLGYGDIYMSTRTDPQDWTSWSTPKNIGKEINSGYAEATISFSPDEKRIYYSVNSSLGAYAAYSFPTTHDASNSYEPYTIDILGMESALLRVRVADMDQQSIVQVVDCSGESNTLTVNIHKGKTYTIMGDAGLSFVPAIMVKPGATTKQRLKGYTFPVLVKSDAPVPLYAVDFAGSDDLLTPVAEVQLEQLARFLSNQPGSVVEFCIDVAGRDDKLAYNISLDRGRQIREFMEGRGIEASRIIVSAYGNVNVRAKGKSAVAVRFREQQ